MIQLWWKGTHVHEVPSKALTCLELSAHPVWHRSKDGPTCSGTVEGQATEDILLDTGCSRTMVRTDLVVPSSVSSTQQVVIRCAHGEAVSYPTALVNMEIEGLQVCVEAAVCKSLPVSVLLGTDVPERFTLLSRVRSQEDSGMAMVTRSKFKQQQLEAREEQVRDLQSGARPTSLEEPTAKKKGMIPAGFQKLRVMTAACQGQLSTRTYLRAEGLVRC